jgi:D-lactate dehydrogenase (cytochrome)
VIKTRRRARKSSAGFDTTKLFIGAEGTLGIVTEGIVHFVPQTRGRLMIDGTATLRLAPRLPTTVATVGFPNVRSAVDAVAEILNTGVPIRMYQFT